MGIFSKKPPRYSQPRVGIVMPCYNGGKFIQDALNSLSHQDYKHLIIAIVNDGSTDDSEDKIAAVLKNPMKAPNNTIVGKIHGFDTVVIKNDNASGASEARNIAIRALHEHVDVYMMLDADDQYLPGKISKSVAKYMESPDVVGIVYTDAIVRNTMTGLEVHEFREPYHRMRILQECIISNTPLISKAALQAVGLYDPEIKVAHDWELYIRITKQFMAIHIPEPLHIYHVHGANITVTLAPQVIQRDYAIIRQKHGSQGD